jgi:hypothetical protein
LCECFYIFFSSIIIIVTLSQWKSWDFSHFSPSFVIYVCKEKRCEEMRDVSTAVMLSDIHSGMMDVRFFLWDFIFFLFFCYKRVKWEKKNLQMKSLKRNINLDDLCDIRRKWRLRTNTTVKSENEWRDMTLKENKKIRKEKKISVLLENIFILSKKRSYERCMWCVMCMLLYTMRWREKLLFQQLFVLLTIWFIIRALTYIEDRIQK